MNADLQNSSSLRLNPSGYLGLTGLVYWLLVMGLWGTFAFDRGLTFETGFPMNCQSSIQQCLIYGDNLRPYNSLFLGLGHLLGKGNGSYITYQLLYGFLWWGRGVLTFLIFARIWSSYPIAGFIIGALVIVQASDSSLNFIGQLHQFGFMAFLALAVYFLIEGWCSTQWYRWLGFVLAALPALYISLWTYESHFFIILMMPLLLLVIRPVLDRKFWLTSLLWYILPAIYGYLQFQRYNANRVNNYQTSILRPDLTLGTILQDWGTHLQQSLQFWRWGENLPISGVGTLATVISIVCTGGFLIGSYLLFATPDRQKLPPPRSLWLSFGSGIVILLLSFPVYLLIANNTSFWRTQMLSGFGAAIVLGSLFLLLAQLFPKARYQTLLAIAATAIVVFSGVQTGVKLQAVHAQKWQVHRAIMAQISHLIPDVKDGTLVLLTNLPTAPEKDGFGAALWFDFPIQLLYPGKKVVGYFTYENGKPPTDNPWMFTETGMQWLKKGMGQEFEQATYSNIIALKYLPDGTIVLLDQFPQELLPQPFNTATYQPRAQMPPNFESNRSIRMFAR